MNHRKAERPQIFIAGAGAAGLEAMLALREIGGDRATVEICSPGEEFVLRPLAVHEAIEAREIPRFDLKALAHEAGAGFVGQAIASVDPEERRVTFDDQSEAGFDYLLVATGTESLPEVSGARTFWGPGSGEALADYRALFRSRAPSRVVLTVPSLSAWPLPIYELALFLAAEIKKTSASVSLTIATPEADPLEAFGEEASARVNAMLDENWIEFLPGVTPIAFQGGSLRTASGDFLGADLVIALPALKGRRIDGLPCDEKDFIRVDDRGRVEGLDRVYAAGDATDFPIKFGGLATAQADLAAYSIAARLWGTPEPDPSRPGLEGILLTPDGPVALGEARSCSEGGPDPGGQLDLSQKIRGVFLSPFISKMIAAEEGR